MYKLCGYSMSRVASSIYNNNGTYVEKANLQLGDLVFFASNSSSIGHVGIYIGSGQFIHSSSGAGCVVISDLSSSYYLKNYVGAKRIAG
ncbi:MAG: C40 family peptidase [Oscillospiraceae bacterium]